MKKLLSILVLSVTLWTCGEKNKTEEQQKQEEQEQEKEEQEKQETLSSAKELTLTFSGGGGGNLIANADNNHTVTLPYDVDLKNVPTPEVVVSPEATYKPKGHTDFSQSVIYTVTAEDKSEKEYTVKVSKKLNDAKELTSVTFIIEGEEKPFVANAENNHTVELPHTVDLSNLPTPEIVVSEGAKHNLSENQVDFSKAITITVTAEDKTAIEYPLIVKRKPAFRSVWRTTKTVEEIVLPIHEGGEYNFTVDWGDDSEPQQVTSHDDDDRKHTYYGKTDTYTIVITGKLIGFNFNKIKASKENIIEIKEWGGIGFWGKMTKQEANELDDDYNAKYGYFYQCSNLEKITATDAPNLSETNNFIYLFRECYKFDSDLSHWKTQGIQNMRDMFHDATKFNNGGKALTFKTDAVTDMYSMFYKAKAFNQDLSSWNTVAVTDMSHMFFDATAFNQNLSGWCVKEIENKPNNFDEGGHPNFTNKADKQPKWGVDCQQ